ncbi:hypothetical protein [Hyphomicrobium facile]|uniref:Uncharacterized protein n=1 Tax=Hyphomicrobium facile TaxID=51670 RepID=A0A1I7NV22_9HYPH|nr:hypothetical protein [Hyphomicrobium facile]SFV38507.1 hypothetical protein SAMN04488557_3704 [Hyphomicrobium facile]
MAASKLRTWPAFGICASVGAALDSTRGKSIAVAAATFRKPSFNMFLPLFDISDALNHWRNSHTLINPAILRKGSLSGSGADEQHRP